MALIDLLNNKVVIQRPDELDRVRFPEIIFTDGYLNDPVQFRPDNRFSPRTVVDQFFELPVQIDRDFADFIQVDRNSDEPQLLTINTFSMRLRRDKYESVFSKKSEFTQLGIT